MIHSKNTEICIKIIIKKIYIMTTKTVKLIVFIFLLVHGIGHFQGVASGFGLKINKKKPARSWLLKNQSNKTNQIVCLLLFFITGIFGILTSSAYYDLILSGDIWETFGLITACLSSVCLIIFPNAFARFFNKAGAIIVNLYLYITILGNHDVFANFINE